MKLLRACLLGTALSAVGGAAMAQELTVWDWKSGDPITAPYYEAAKQEFEAAHPGVTITHVPQPHDQYYSLLGTAIGANQGPDLVLLHGGTQTTDRTEALVPLTAAVADIQDRLAGWDSFSKDGEIYAVPISTQGFVLYYNKDLYTAAGLDPEAPPTTWEQLSANCEAIAANTEASCFALGNKEGYGMEFFFSATAAGLWTPEQFAKWHSGELSWTDPAVKRIFELWVEAKDKGWYQEGANSTAMFPDSWEIFERSDAAHVIGLISDVANWKEFEEFLGPEVVGTFRPVLIDPALTTPDQMGIPIAGGIGYAVPRWTPNQELAIAYAKTLAAPENLAIFFESAGAIVPDKQFDTSGTDSPGVKAITGWIGCCAVPIAHNDVSVAGLQELHRQSQMLLNDESTVDEALAAMAAADTARD